jgi:ABC-2 type transport system permease protein
VVAELLRLKARLLRNGFRRPPIRIIGSGLLLVIALAGLVVLFGAASRVTVFDGQIVGRVVAVVGADVSLGVLLVPIMFSRMQLLEPRAFLGYGIRSPALAAALLLTTLVGPALLLIPLVLVPIVAWGGFPEAGALPWVVAPLLLVQLLLLLRIGVALGARLRAHPAARAWIRLLGVIVLLGGLATLVALVLPRAVLLAPERSLASLAPAAHALAPVHAERIADALAGSPLASLWGAPGLAAAGVGSPAGAVLIGLITLPLLALLWWGLVAGALRPTHRLHLDRAVRVPGWFRGLPPSPAGAVAARSFIYWVRDPRYRVVFGILPILPIVTIAAFWVGGVPNSIAAMVPLPLMVLVLAWSTIHNDIAYDSTAVWSHLAAQTRGIHDRLGRIWPVLAFGTVLIALGTPITVWAQGSTAALPAVLGITIALLLGGVGVGSGMSVRYPYPAPRPGDGAFTYPQASGGTGGGAQGGSFFLTILVAAPPIAATTLWLFGFPGQWPLIALGTGIVSGLLALVIGIRAGGSTFDRRGPELLAFTMQN